jgi:hypothetical protein
VVNIDAAWTTVAALGKFGRATRRQIPRPSDAAQVLITMLRRKSGEDMRVSMNRARRGLYAAAAVLALTAATPVLAQEVLQVGDRAGGALAEGDESLESGEKVDVFVFRGQAGQQITMRMTSSAFDPYLSISGPSDFSDWNDDASDGDRNSLLSVRLPADGTYRIFATSFEPGERGDYQISLEAGGISTADVGDGGGSIAPGQSARGQLSANDPTLEDESHYDEWTLTGAPGARYVVRLASSDFDPFLAVTGTDFQDANDDDPTERGSRNSRLEIIMPSDGRATIRANSFNAGETGVYTLAVEEAGGDEAAPAPIQAAGDLRVGGQVRGQLADGSPRLESGEFYQAYSLNGRAGQTIELTLNGDGFDPYVSIQGPDGFAEYNDDDPSGAIGRNSRLTVTLPADGQYNIVATSYAPGESGGFTLAAASAQAPVVEDAPETQVASETLADGPAAIDLAGDLSAADPVVAGGYADSFRFVAQAGQPLDVSLTSDAFDAFLILTTPSGEQIVNDDDEGTNSRIRTTLEESGQYVLTATSFTSGSTGDYRLRSSGGTYAAVSAEGRLAAGDDQREGSFADRHVFVGRAGDAIGISLNSTDFDPVLVLRSPSGEEIVNDDFNGERNSRIETTLRESGEYTLIATSFGDGETGSYQLVRGPADTVLVDNRPTAGGPQVYAVMVGISDYAGAASNLAYTAEDATKLADTLRQRGVLNPASITLTEAEATTENVAAAIRQVGAQAGPDDIFLFFYSGHGAQVDAGVSPVEPDGRTETIYLRDGHFTDEQMSDLFGQLHTRLSLLVLDSCFSGGFARNVVDRPGVMGLFSSEEDLTSAVPDKFQAGGYMSNYLQEALTGRADENSDSLITAGELSSYVRERFRGDGPVESQTREGQRNYQYFVVDRGGVQVDDPVLRL